MNLSFLHPGLLTAGLACVAIPVIIHYLLRRKRTPVEWGAMRFLLEAHRRRRRRLTLEQLLLLAARCLLIALIAGAIAAPLIGSSSASRAPRTLVILLDNTLTSETVTTGARTELDDNKQRALAQLAALDPAKGDLAALITLSAPAQAVIAMPTANLPALRRAIEQAEPTDAAADWPGASAAIAAILAAENTDKLRLKSIFIASALRAGSLPVSGSLPPIVDHAVEVVASSPASSTPSNTSVTGIEPMRRTILGTDRPGSLGVVRVTLSRSAPLEPAATELKLYRDQQPKPIGRTAIRWPRGQREQTAAIAIGASATKHPLGPIVLRVEIGSDALPADNTRSALVAQRAAIRVAIVAPTAGARATAPGFTSSDWLAAALTPSDDAPIETVAVDPSAFASHPLVGIDAVALLDPAQITPDGWQRAAALLDAGVPVLLTPSPTQQAQTWTDAAIESLHLPWVFRREPVDVGSSTPIAAPTHDPLLAALEAELPGLLASVHIDQAMPPNAREPARPLLTLPDGSPWLTVFKRGPDSGTILYLASAIDTAWTDLPAKPLFVPLMQELIRQSVRTNAGVEAVAGRAFSVPTGSHELIAISHNKSLRIDPLTRMPDPIRSAATYRAIDRDGRTIALVAVNPAAAAGDLTPTDLAETARLLAALSPGVPVRFVDTDTAPDSSDPVKQGPTAPARPLAWLLLLLAALVALAEPALGRIASHAEVGA